MQAYAVEFGLLAAGVRFDSRFDVTVATLVTQVVVSALMWVPGLTALALRKWWLREGFAEAGLRIGPLKPYLWVWLAVPAAFALIYGITWLVGLGHPDPALGGFVERIRSCFPNCCRRARGRRRSCMAPSGACGTPP